MTQEEKDYRDGVFTDTVADERVRARVYAHISFMADDTEPAVAPADIQAARSYLRRCMDNMTMSELSQKPIDDLAALWARGALGAARYRVRERRGTPPGRGRARENSRE